MINTPTSNNNSKQSKSTEISYYNSLTDTTNHPISIELLLSLIQTGNGFINNIIELRQENEKDKINEIKKLLPAVTISGLFENSRKFENLISYSGFIQLDFDDVVDVIQSKIALQNDKFTFAVFISPTGKGLKLLVKVPLDKIKHLKSFKELEKYYKVNYNLIADKQCKDITRLMFLSWDENIFVNENSNLWKLSKNTNFDLFNSILNKLNQTEKFEEGKRNEFVFKLGCESYKNNIEIDFVINEIKKLYSSYDFKEEEIVATVRSAYKTKSNSIQPLKEKNSYSLLKRVEVFLESKYEIRLNEVSNKIEYKIKDSNNHFRDLNEYNIFRELQHTNLNLPLNKLYALLYSDFVTSYNPFVQYFEELPIWEEETETDYINNLCKYIPVKDKERFEIQFKKMLVRCIACAFENNVFNKQVFVLVGEGQNTGKSTFCRWLCPPYLADYITENINTDKDGLIGLTTNFFINMDELATLSKAEINILKSFISKDKVNIRLPFAKRASVHPRRANFIGSTNNDEFLTDETGSVRWLCFEITGTLNFDYKIEIDINDVWKQAYFLYKNNFVYQLTPNEIKENEAANNSFMVATQEIQLVNKYLKPATKETGEFLDATDIQNFLNIHNAFLKTNTRNIGKAMKYLGFIKTSEYNSEKKYSNKGYYIQKMI